MERRSRDPYAPLFGEDPGQPGDRWRPAVDVFETEKSWVVRVAVAGVANRDLRVAVERDVLCVRGVRSPHTRALGGEEVRRHHQLEIEPGPFEARVPIAGAIERDQVEARLEDGVLTVRLPKRAPRRIEIQEPAEPGTGDES